MSGEQSISETLDISERLRVIMSSYKLSVADLAGHAGVSKSTMEKYLAGPSSPRATALASLCASLQVNAEWLIFGHADDDIRRIQQIGTHSITALLQEIKQPGPLKDEFEAHELGSSEWRLFSLNLGAERAHELASLVNDRRKKALKMAADGYRIVALEPHPLVTKTESEFRASDKKS